MPGVGSLTLNDDNPVTEDALAANFLTPLDEKMGGGGSLAELCCDSLKDFNPMVHVSVEKGIGRNIYCEHKCLSPLSLLFQLYATSILCLSICCAGDLSRFYVCFFEKFDKEITKNRINKQDSCLFFF